jgi:hypothetical protein
MSRNFDFIKDLNKERAIWKIAVRVVDSWVVTGTNGFQHLEMVIADEKVCALLFFFHSVLFYYRL